MLDICDIQIILARILSVNEPKAMLSFIKYEAEWTLTLFVENWASFTQVKEINSVCWHQQLCVLGAYPGLITCCYLSCLWLFLVVVNWHSEILALCNMNKKYSVHNTR